MYVCFTLKAADEINRSDTMSPMQNGAVETMKNANKRKKFAGFFRKLTRHCCYLWLRSFGFVIFINQSIIYWHVCLMDLLSDWIWMSRRWMLHIFVTQHTSSHIFFTNECSKLLTKFNVSYSFTILWSCQWKLKTYTSTAFRCKFTRNKNSNNFLTY